MIGVGVKWRLGNPQGKSKLAIGMRICLGVFLFSEKNPGHIMNLDISTSIEFVKDRTAKTAAVQATLAALPTGAWVWPLKTVAAWTADDEQLDGAKPGTVAQVAKAAGLEKQQAFSVLDTRYTTLHTRTLQAVGVMRSRALADASLRPVVDELSARGDSNRAIEEEGEELLAAWSLEFGENFVPAPDNTYVKLKELFEGAAAPVAVPTLRKLKTDYKEARARGRRAEGVYNVLISRLEDECVQWYAEATAVFPEGTTNGDLIRGQIPTSYNPPTPAPAGSANNSPA